MAPQLLAVPSIISFAKSETVGLAGEGPFSKTILFRLSPTRPFDGPHQRRCRESQQRTRNTDSRLTLREPKPLVSGPCK